MADELITPRSNPYFRDPRIRRLLIRYKFIDRYGNILRASSASAPPRPRRDRSTGIRRYDDRQTKLTRRNQSREEPFVENKRTDKSKKRHHSISQDLPNTGQPLPLFRDKRGLRRAKSAYHASEDFPGRPLRYGVNTKSPKKPLCRVIIKYLGSQPLLEHDDRWLGQKGDEIVVMQQHCGGENLTVFKGYVKPYHTFTFDSRRHQDYGFALSFYINGLINCRVSVCCEFKHKKNAPLGGPSGSFAIQDVLHAKPCETCQFERMRKRAKTRSKKPPTDPRYQRSVVPHLPRRPSTPSSTPPEPSVSAGERRSSLPNADQRSTSPSISKSPTSSSKKHPSSSEHSDSSSLKNASQPVVRHDDADQKRPGSADTWSTRPKTAKPRQATTLNALQETERSSGDESIEHETIDSRSKTTPVRRISTNQTSDSSGRTTPVPDNLAKKKSSALNALGDATATLTNETLIAKQSNTSQNGNNTRKYSRNSDELNGGYSHQNSQVNRSSRSSTESYEKNPKDNFHASKPATIRSTFSESTDHHPKLPLSETTPTKEKTNGHLKKSSSNTLSASDSFEDESFEHKSPSLSGQYKKLGHVRSSSSDSERKLGSSDNDDDRLYEQEKSHDRKELIPPVMPVPAAAPPPPQSRKASDSTVSDRYTQPLRPNLPDEPLPRPKNQTNSDQSGEKLSTSFEDFFGTKSSTKKETRRITDDRESDFFNSNNTRKTTEDIEAFVRRPASTKPDFQDRKAFFDDDDD